MREFKVTITQTAMVTINSEEVEYAARQAIRDFNNNDPGVEYFQAEVTDIEEITEDRT